MNEIILISAVSLVASLLTFFSGFGLGTILMPIFALFFPVEIAVALTGVVHFLNNLFKLGLVGFKADKAVILRFGIPAVIAAFAGAFVLIRISGLDPLYSYVLWDREFYVIPVKLVIAFLLILFSVSELIPLARDFQFGKKYMIFGGLLSGFFGGLSGNQGALRSAFLIKSGLEKDAFIATGIVIACLVDFSRLGIYLTGFAKPGIVENLNLVLIATLSAFAGALLGNKLLKKITLWGVKVIVAIMLISLSIAIGTGIV
jgi:hypothetical protein